MVGLKDSGCSGLSSMGFAKTRVRDISERLSVVREVVVDLSTQFASVLGLLL